MTHPMPSSVERLTDRLLQKTVGLPLDIFIQHHLADGGDRHSLQASLLLATDHLFDARTIQSWINLHGSTE